MNPHFDDAIANSLGISGVAGLFKSIDTGKDLGATLAVLEVFDPVDKRSRLDELCHDQICLI
jgi:hypothetical protein